MKKYVMLLAFTVAASSWISLIPKAVASSYNAVGTVRLKSTDLMATVDCKGRLDAVNAESVCYGIPVKVKKSYVKIGDKVKKGDRLFDIDKTITLQALVNLCGDNKDADDTASESTDPAIDSAVSAFASQSGYDSDTLQQALNAGIIDKNTYNQLQEKMKQAQSASSQVNVTESMAQKMVDELPDTVYSPINGTVTYNASVSQGIIASGNIVTISDLSTMVADVLISEKKIASVKAGQGAVITGQGFKGSYTGAVGRVNPTADSKDDAGTAVEAEININSPRPELMPGLDVSAVISTAKKTNVVIVPYEAIMQDDDNNEYVYIFDSGIAEKRYIKTGQETDSGEEALSGVKAGDIVVTEKPESLYDGEKIRLKR